MKKIEHIVLLVLVVIVAGVTMYQVFATALSVTNDAYTILQASGSHDFSVLENDTGDSPLSVTAVGSSSNGASTSAGGRRGEAVSYSAPNEFCGEDSFTYTVTDANMLTASGTITVTVTCAGETPTLTETVVVSTPTNDTTPEYSFTSDTAGTITYGGGCTSETTLATVGTNQITFDALVQGVYDRCTIVVTNEAEAASDPLSITSFTIDTTAPVITEITPIPASVSGDSAIYYFSNNDSRGGSYRISVEDTETRVQPRATVDGDAGTITFASLAAGHSYSGEIIYVDQAGNSSNTLTVGTFTVEGDREVRSSAGSTTSGSVPYDSRMYLTRESVEVPLEKEKEKENENEKESLLDENTLKEVPTIKETFDRILAPSSPSVPQQGGGQGIVRTLGFGSQGEIVRALQKFLNIEGFSVAPSGPGSLGKETTFFGPKTRNALFNYQVSHKIKTDGILGPETNGIISKDIEALLKRE